MSHELRTPLNSVIGFSRLMADSKNMLPEEKRNLAIIHRSGQHLLTLINDILELSKIEAGRAVLQTEVVNLNDMLQEVMDMVSMRAGQTGVELVLDSVGLPASARGRHQAAPGAAESDVERGQVHGAGQGDAAGARPRATASASWRSR
jgi:signal transduction histidine kinase